MVNPAQIKAEFDKLKNRVSNVFFRGTIRATKPGSKKESNTAQVETIGTAILEDVPIVQDYGFASRPKPGSRAITVNLCGSSDNSVIIATDDARYRVDLEDGEVALYTDEGDKIHFRRDRILEIVSKKIKIDADLIVFSGTLQASEIRDSFGTLSKFRENYLQHTHTSTAPGTPTSPPTPPPAPLLPEIPEVINV